MTTTTKGHSLAISPKIETIFYAMHFIGLFPIDVKDIDLQMKTLKT